MKKFSKKLLVDELDLPYSAKIDNVVDNTRWSIIHEIIFEYEDKFYRTSYSTGATESQDEGPWEYEDFIECDEVHQVEKIVKVWEKV